MGQFKVKLAGRTMLLRLGEHDIGRMSDCWLTLDDELASRYHSRFLVEEDTLTIVDLESRNGTYVNGARITAPAVLRNGDTVRIGREVLTIQCREEDEQENRLRQTLAPGEDTQFPSLIGQLVEKSLKAGKVKEAERYAVALTTQLGVAKVPLEHPASQATVSCLLGLAERTTTGVWIGKLFSLFASQGWIMDEGSIERIRTALDTTPRIPGTGIADYERTLRGLERDGTVLPGGLTATIAELADAYAGS